MSLHSTMMAAAGSEAHSRAIRVAGFAGLFGLIAAPAVAGAGMPAGAMLATALLGVLLALLSAIDWATYRLPDVLTLPLAAAGLILAWVNGWGDPALRAGAAVAGGAGLALSGWLYEYVRGRPGLGLGDAKLYGAAGAWVGFEGLASVLLLACGAAMLFLAAAHLRGRKLALGTAIPFGPFLALGAWMVWLYGPIGP